MIKVRIHINNELELAHSLVYAECLLPCLPPINSVIHIPLDMQKKLEKQMKRANGTEKYLIYETPVLDGYIYVVAYKFIPDVDYVSIEISDKLAEEIV